MPRDRFYRIIAAIAIIAGVAFSWHADGLPREVQSSGFDDAFSEKTARLHLDRIARVSRALGTEGHTLARSYISGSLTAEDYDVDSSDIPYVLRSSENISVAAHVSNVIARSRTRHAGGPIIVVCHYDSVPTSTGAADDGIAVAALLEVARALQHGAALRHELVLLFTDGEEIGSLGAAAFLEKTPAARDAFALLNFDARGTAGPSLLFEVSRPNTAMLKTVAALPRPRASSLASEVYERMQNDTDFTIFKQAGIRGLNFAFIDQFSAYHSRLDDLAHVRGDTLAYTGETMLTLIRAIDTSDAQPTFTGSIVFFDLFGRVLVVYSGTAAAFLAGLTALTFLILIVALRRRSRLGLLKVASSIAALSLVCVTSIGCGWLAWVVVELIAPNRLAVIHGEPRESGLFLFAFACVAGATAVGCLSPLRKRWKDVELATGATGLCTIALIACVVAAPGASYLFQWPLAGALIGLAALAFSSRSERILALVACALPAISIAVPVVRDTHTALTLQAIVPLLTLIVITVMCSAPIILGLIHARTLLVSLSLLSAALIGIVAALYLGSYDADWPQPSSLAYVLDADAGSASWAVSTTDNGWARAQLGPNVVNRPMAPFFSSTASYTVAAAPRMHLPEPTLSVVRTELRGSKRVIIVRVKAARSDSMLELSLESQDAEIFAVDGIALQSNRAGNRVRVWASPATGFDIEVRLKGPATLRLIEVIFGQIDDSAGSRVRPESTMAVPFGFGLTDSIRVGRSLQL